MKLRTVLLISGLLLLAVSCIPSLYPLYRSSDLLIDDRLEGVFDAGDNSYWKIRRIDPDFEKKLPEGWKRYNSGYTYKLTVKEKNGAVEDFAMHLLKLGDNLYMDFFPVNYRIRHEFLAMHLVPAHIFAKAELEDRYLVLHFFNMDWLEELIDTKRIKISCVEVGDRYVLTTPTEELQKFILKYSNDSTTFIEPDTLRKSTAETALRDFSIRSGPQN
jgi:hypothetical protein